MAEEDNRNFPCLRQGKLRWESLFMNKGFFVVFLGVILGAMALIFVNQAAAPTAVAPVSQQMASATASSDAPAPDPLTPVSAPEGAARQPEPSVAEPAMPEPAMPEPAMPEPAKPESAKPEPAKPEPAKPEPAKPEPAKPEPAKPEPAKPEPAKPEPAKPEPAAQPETMKLEPPTATPETPVKPEKAAKSLNLVNIGLHFKGNGMALRIEANAPFSYKTFALPNPDRYVVDLVGVWNNMRAPTVPSNNMIKSARVGKQAGGPRLVLDMHRAPKRHTVTWISRTVLEILIE